jgi:putative SOS response-associated peptidase YedK
MCGRYTLIKLSDFTDMFPWISPADDPPPEAAPPRYNIAPTQPIAVVPNNGKNQVEFFRWGLVPFWARDISAGAKMINARAETLSRKPAFQKLLERRRCIVPASGFYEWKKFDPSGKAKQPMYIRMIGAKPFAFAGLWDTWRSPDGSKLRSCTIITGAPNELVASIHNRMPAILRPEDYRKWLEPGEVDSGALQKLLAPYPAEQMEAIPVSRAVNNVATDTPECIEGITAESPPPAQVTTSRKRRAHPAADEPTLF